MVLTAVGPRGLAQVFTLHRAPAHWALGTHGVVRQAQERKGGTANLRRAWAASHRGTLGQPCTRPPAQGARS